jgi:glutaredoxin
MHRVNDWTRAASSNRQYRHQFVGTRIRALIHWIGPLLLLAAATPLGASAAPPEQVAVVAPSRKVTIEAYVQEGCPHCAAAEAYLRALAAARPEVELVVFDVAHDAAARERMRRRASAAGIAALGVPMIAVGERIHVGFSSEETTGRQLVALLDAAARPTQAAPDAACAAPPGDTACSAAEADEVELPLFGHVRVRELGLPLFTLVVGLLDGFNPCAMWVLLFLLSLLAGLRDRRRMAAIGGTFVLVSGAAYFAFMAAWLNVFLLIGVSWAVELVLGGVALVIGALNVKDALGPGRGPSLKIPESAKPGIYRRVRAIVQAERTLGAVAAAAVLAVLVNVIELACTAGLPAVYTRVLTAHHLPAWSYYGYLLLYIAAYMFDDGLMVAIALVTLSRTRLQERGGRVLKLISGSVMVFLGLALVAFPQWLVW